MARTIPCDSVVLSGRMAKAERFADAAAVVHEFTSEAADIADPYVTLCVHAGIAGGDVICCARLGEYSRGENHSEAVKLMVGRRRRLDHPGDMAVSACGLRRLFLMGQPCHPERHSASQPRSSCLAAADATLDLHSLGLDSPTHLTVRTQDL